MCSSHHTSYPTASCFRAIILYVNLRGRGRGDARQHVRTPNEDRHSSALLRASMRFLASVVLELTTLADIGSFFAFSSFLVPLPFLPIFPLSPQPGLVWRRSAQERDSARIRSARRQRKRVRVVGICRAADGFCMNEKEAAKGREACKNYCSAVRGGCRNFSRMKCKIRAQASDQANRSVPERL